jgi:Putative polyhydroxyalkanoic acid system protein (PHA_gran_rgn)
VSGQNFDLEVKLGMMMSAFKPVIESEIKKNLGKLLGK